MATFNPSLGIEGNRLCLHGFFCVKVTNQPWDYCDAFATRYGDGEFNRSGGSLSGNNYSRTYVFDDKRAAIAFQLAFGERS